MFPTFSLVFAGTRLCDSDVSDKISPVFVSHELALALWPSRLRPGLARVAAVGGKL